MLFFFVSSRRRHTRWPRDWSSDVCSSDLALDSAPVGLMAALGEDRELAVGEVRGGEGGAGDAQRVVVLVSDDDLVVGDEDQIGRASCRERVESPEGDGSARGEGREAAGGG